MIAERDDKKVIVATDCDLMIIKDVRPAAHHHYVVMSREHYVNPSQLEMKHIPVIRRMKRFALDFIRMRIPFHDHKRLSIGSHWPPFHTVEHLHFHILHPITDYSPRNKVRYSKESENFLTLEDIISRIKPPKKKTVPSNLRIKF